LPWVRERLRRPLVADVEVQRLRLRPVVHKRPQVSLQPEQREAAVAAVVEAVAVGPTLFQPDRFHALPTANRI